MANTINIEIKESAEDLKTLLRKQSNTQKKERIQALYLLKSGQVTTLEALSKMLARDTSTIYRWFQKYKHKGLDGLLKLYKPAGRPLTIPPGVLEKLKQKLQESDGFKSYGEIQQWLKDECGVEVEYHAVYRTVRYKLKGKLKASKHSSVKKDKEEEAISTPKVVSSPSASLE